MTMTKYNDQQNAAKLISLKEMSSIRKKLSDKTIVTVNGSFDIIHPGHIFTLKTAKEQGDILIVGLNSDRSVRSYKNGKGPIIDEAGRATILSAIEYVDYIVLFDEPNPIKFLEHVCPDIHCNAASYGKDCVEAKTVIDNGGKIFLIDDNICSEDGKYSTSAILEKIARQYKPSIKAVFLDRDGVVDVDVGYPHKVEDVALTNNCIKGLKRFKDAGFKFFIITNQSGIARGMYLESDMHRFNNRLLELLGEHGIAIEKIYFCPHHPDFTGVCDCRKPRWGLFSKAKKEFNIDMENSIAIGDKTTDTIAAKGASVGITIQIKRNGQKNIADILADDLLDAYGKLIEYTDQKQIKNKPKTDNKHKINKESNKDIENDGKKNTFV